MDSYLVHIYLVIEAFEGTEFGTLKLNQQMAP